MRGGLALIFTMLVGLAIISPAVSLIDPRKYKCYNRRCSYTRFQCSLDHAIVLSVSCRYQVFHTVCGCFPRSETNPGRRSEGFYLPRGCHQATDLHSPRLQTRIPGLSWQWSCWTVRQHRGSVSVHKRDRRLRASLQHVQPGGRWLQEGKSFHPGWRYWKQHWCIW